MFCVVCGKETPDLTEGGICGECFVRDTVFARLPQRLDVEVCAHCGSRKRGEIWLQPPRVARGRAPIEPDEETLLDTKRAVKETAIDGVDLDPRVERPNYAVESRMQDQHGKMWATTLTMTGEAEGLRVSSTASTVVRVKGATCLRCSRLLGGYHEGIIQIRATSRDLSRDEIGVARRIASRLIERVVSEGDLHAFVLKDIEIEGGLDIYFGTTNAARMAAKSIAQELGATTKEHAKLVGLKDGLDVFRMTFAIRVPPYRKGDLAIVDEEPWLVQSVAQNAIHLRKPSGGHTRTMSRDEVAKLTILARAEAREAVVVNRSEKELDVLDPSSFATVTVLRPDGIPDDAATVPVARFEDELLVFPPVKLDES